MSVHDLGTDCQQVGTLTSRTSIQRGLGLAKVFKKAGYKRSEVERLAKLGWTDPAIAAMLHISTIWARKLRVRSGIRYGLGPKVRINDVHALNCARIWFAQYGLTPTASDWNPSRLKQRGDKDRLKRFQDFDQKYNCPHSRTVNRHFGSWRSFIDQAGLPLPPAGSYAHRRYR